MALAPAEKSMWIDDKGDMPERLDDRAINDRYTRGEGRIVIETNREKLPGFVNQIKTPNYMDLRPFYQRRPRWTINQQSLLIESFIMNIPVPPVFLYEKEFNSYEVMDGQQRITAIRDFYENSFQLRGLEMWPELNGRNYKMLPEKIKAGIDRRSITSIVLLKESTENEDESFLLRETVFERLNTGGVKLERQEIRNALYRSVFNELIEELTKLDSFRDTWQLPLWVENEITTNKGLLDNSFYSKMGDAEIVLRFFALRHVDNYRRGMQGFLDIYMRRASRFTHHDIDYLRHLYIRTLDIVRSIYGDLIFRVYQSNTDIWDTKPHKAFHDAVMIGVAERLSFADKLIERSDQIIESTKELFQKHADGTFTGRANTKADIQGRIDHYSAMLDCVLAG